MCGRFTLTASPKVLAEAFPGLALPADYTPRYNITPTQNVLVIANRAERQFEFMRWGLVPSWAKDDSVGNRMINARAETLAEKPSFRAALKKRRCLIIADGFYEWQTLPGQKTKQPQFIHLTGQTPFAFAGLWEFWQPAGRNPLLSCTIITTEPNPLMAAIHNRMPVILPPNHYDHWLDPGELPGEAAQSLLTAYPAEAMNHYPVSNEVNRPTADHPRLILPLAA